MAVLTKGTTYATTDQVTAAGLNALVDSATFASGAVDSSTTQLSSGAIIVKDLGITTAKIAALAVTSAKLDTNIAVSGTLGVTGDTTLSALVDISGASAGQISFPATQNASAGANTLDDYEEGSWTPSIGGTASYTTQNGRYTKVGRVVHVECRLIINVVGTGNSSVISGLPFAANSAVAGTVGYFASLALSPVFITAFANSSTLVMAGLTVGAASITSNLACIGSGTDLAVACTYTV